MRVKSFGRRERRLERLGDRLLEHRRLDARVAHVDPHLRIHDARQQVDRNPSDVHGAEHEQRARDHDGPDRTADGPAGDTATLVVMARFPRPCRPPRRRGAVPNRRAAGGALSPSGATTRALAPSRSMRRAGDDHRVAFGDPLEDLREPGHVAAHAHGASARSGRLSRRRPRARRPDRTPRATAPAARRHAGRGRRWREPCIPAAGPRAASRRARLRPGTRRVALSADGKMRRICPSTRCPPSASTVSGTTSPARSVLTSSSETWTRVTSVLTSATVKRRVDVGDDVPGLDALVGNDAGDRGDDARIAQPRPELFVRCLGRLERRAIALELRGRDDLLLEQLLRAIERRLRERERGLRAARLGLEFARVDFGQHVALADPVSFFDLEREQDSGELRVHADRANRLEHPGDDRRARDGTALHQLDFDGGGTIRCSAAAGPAGSGTTGVCAPTACRFTASRLGTRNGQGAGQRESTPKRCTALTYATNVLPECRSLPDRTV